MKLRIGEVGIALAGVMMMTAGTYAHHRAVAAQRRPAATAAPVPSLPTGSFAVVGARIFDGRAVVDDATVVVLEGRIQAVGKGVPVPAGVPTVEGRGKTLMPGLIDSHTHVYQDALVRALQFGVTTEIDMFTDVRFAAGQKAAQREGTVVGRADLVSSGTLATAPGGHGTEYGIPVATLTRPEEAQAFVDARIAEGSDFIKIIYDDAASYGLALPTLSRETMTALVAAAHRRGKLAVVHVSTRQAAREAVAAGADGLAHAPAAEGDERELVRLAQRQAFFMVPTLSVVASTAGETGAARALVEDPALAPFVTAEDRATLNAGFPSLLREKAGSRPAAALTAALHTAGVRILAGTDAPNPGTAHGISLHGELVRLVEAGLSPVDALAAATAVPAEVFGLADRGRIAPGLRADLLLLDGDPTREIRDTRKIARIWKGGVEVSRRAATSAPVAPVIADGQVSDFETGAATSFGAGWQVSTDAMLGGKSEAAMEVVRGGAGASGSALEIRGRMAPGSMYPWAGAMFFAGATPMAPVDLSRFTSLTFHVQGDGGTYQVMLFSSKLGRIPASLTFTTTGEWQEVELPLARFGHGVDGNGVQAVLFSGRAGQAAFRFRIDNVRFR